MTKRFHILIVIVLGLFPQLLLSQKIGVTKICYQDKFAEKSKVFTRMEHKPQFKGGRDALLNFLMTNISSEKLASDIRQNERVYGDTARVKFIISRNGILSDLIVTLTKKQVFQSEILKVIKKSSCLWQPGNFARNVDGWLQFDIYYLIDRRDNEITTKVKIREFDYVTD